MDSLRVSVDEKNKRYHNEISNEIGSITCLSVIPMKGI